MVKTLAFFWLTMVGVCIADPFTNAMSLVGVPLGFAQISALPVRDASSPDSVFLGIVRSLQTGEIVDLYYHFETNYLASITEYASYQSISVETASSFRTTMQDSSLSNIVIAAYSSSTSNQFIRINALLQENFSQRSIAEPLRLTLGQYSGNWKIVSYDDDNWDD